MIRGLGGCKIASCHGQRALVVSAEMPRAAPDLNVTNQKDMRAHVPSSRARLGRRPRHQLAPIGKARCPSVRDRPCSPGSGDLELFVAEVGDELEGTAEGGDVAVQDVLGGDVAAFNLGDPGD